VGPLVSVTPVTTSATGRSNLVSDGVVYLFSSTIEVLFQLLKEDIPDVTQGYVRDIINEFLSTKVNE
jgi:hypothetical protein